MAAQGSLLLAPPTWECLADGNSSVNAGYPQELNMSSRDEAVKAQLHYRKWATIWNVTNYTLGILAALAAAALAATKGRSDAFELTLKILSPGLAGALTVLKPSGPAAKYDKAASILYKAIASGNNSEIKRAIIDTEDIVQ